MRCGCGQASVSRLAYEQNHPPLLSVPFRPPPTVQEAAAALSASGQEAGRGEWLGPLRALARRKEVWAICIAQYCGSWGLYGLISWLPTYFTDQFGVSMAELPAFTFLPYLIQGGVGLGVGALADKLLERGWSRLLVRRVMQVAGMVAPAAALLAAVSLAGESSVQTAALLVVRARDCPCVACGQWTSHFGAGQLSGAMPPALAHPTPFQATTSLDLS